MHTLFIFRRDLRLEDNRGLSLALKEGKSVIPCFIFSPEQIDDNPYRSDHCLQFMLESLEDLEEQIKEKGGKLYYFYGPPHEVVEKCLKKLPIDHVVANRDYTPYSHKRDEKIGAICKKYKVPFTLCDDALLHLPEATIKADKKPYTLFTPYFKNASRLKVDPPQKNQTHRYANLSISFAEKNAFLRNVLPHRNPHPRIPGGRKAGLALLKKMGQFKSYAKERDFPEKDKTTHLSAYLKFTALSPREVYARIAEELGKTNPLIRSLYWRDFFTHIAFFFPHIFQGAFHSKYDQIEWSHDKKAFKKWCEGKTGFPIVDAGMRELNETGFMHNRARMISASFLVKDLHMDWRWGEKYFAQQLVDYDPAVNNGNWQWVASTGCDAQPYFRIFNPWNQQIKFDPDCAYIKRWVPELKQATAKQIHSGEASEPMLDHAKEAAIALKAYRRAAR